MARNSVPTEALDIPAREELVDSLTLHTCLRNCTGKSGAAAGCCTLGTRAYIIGPIPDTAELLARLSERLERDVPYDEVFVDYAEGSKAFPDNPEWQRQVCYPALRVRMDDPSFPCRFLADDNLCSIHDIRSVTCSRYSCDHLTTLIAGI